MSDPLSTKQVSSIVATETKKISLWVGAVSAGKTIASLFALLARVRMAQGTGLIVIVGKTLQTIERNIITPLQDYRLFGVIAKSVVHTRGSNTAWILGKTVELVGANDVRSEEKIRGSTIELAYVDEATLLPLGFWEMLVSRLRTPNPPYLLATTNPGSKRHWLRLEWILQAAAKNMQVFHFTMDDNPSLTADYVRDMKASYSGIFYDRFINGYWTNAEGAVFDAWDEKRHVIKYTDLPRMQRVLGVGIDYGTTNATSAILLGLGVDDRLYAIDEWRHDSRAHADAARLTNASIVKGITGWLGGIQLPDGSRPSPEWLIIDPSAASLRVELHEQGVINVFSANNEVIYGIQTVSSMLDSGHLYVSEKCTGLINEMSEYVWDPKATERGEDKPLKANDHSVDALRYAVTSTETNWRPYIKLAA
ncbi:MAG: PBSX family phage terminase large subunit [Renibacterium salmoninarum]|nr:PBSX family phage terminase large subunit [Renibacterium salmoninarum]